MADKVQTYIQKGKCVRVKITREWDIDPERWDEFKEHLQRCHNHPQIANHYDYWGLNWYMEGVGLPDRVSYDIREVTPGPSKKKTTRKTKKKTSKKTSKQITKK